VRLSTRHILLHSHSLLSTAHGTYCFIHTDFSRLHAISHLGLFCVHHAFFAPLLGGFLVGSAGSLVVLRRQPRRLQACLQPSGRGPTEEKQNHLAHFAFFDGGFSALLFSSPVRFSPVSASSAVFPAPLDLGFSVTAVGAASDFLDRGFPDDLGLSAFSSPWSGLGLDAGSSAFLLAGFPVDLGLSAFLLCGLPDDLGFSAFLLGGLPPTSLFSGSWPCECQGTSSYRNQLSEPFSGAMTADRLPPAWKVRGRGLLA
jgi:hypothetical protein